MAIAEVEEPNIAVQPEKNKRKKAPARTKKQPVREPKAPQTENTPTFFQAMGRIQKEDWGPRATIYLYRVEPVIDRLRASDKKYIMTYAEPINEDKILADHGSGRYKAVLNFKKPAANQGDEIDSYYFDILNIQFPPKIPQGEWTDDPRNKRWAWAKQKEAPAAAPAQTAGGIVEAMQAVSDIRKTTIEELKASQPQQASRISEFTEFLTAAKAMAPQPAAPPPPATENAILNTVVILFTKQIDAQAEQIKELRQEIREAHKAPQTNGLGTVTEVVNGLGNLLPKVKELFPNLGDAVGTKSRMGPWMEFFQPTLTELAGALKPLAGVLAAKLMTNGQPTQQQQQPQMPGQLNPAQQPTQSQSATIPPIIQFLNAITPAVMRHMNEWLKDTSNEAFSGKGLASSIDDLYGDKWNGVDWLTEARTAGVDNIVAAYQQSKLWEKLSQVEPQFRQFIADFIGWQRPVDLETEEPEASTDLTQVM
jgi:hypothetical protein